jgi:phenolic acid decarboxylase
VIRRVRDTAIGQFRDAITQMLPEGVSQALADRTVADLTAVAVALSDGIYFAEHLEPDGTDVAHMYRRLFQAVSALIPILLEEK